MDLLGKTVGNYRIGRLVGEGGIGAVYQALAPFTAHDVAPKSLRVIPMFAFFSFIRNAFEFYKRIRSKDKP